ncbi:Acetoacetyl-CoA reductase [Paraglaciecola mesophila]|uniref:Acetoacetyl-CoA reductase n=1 Tax=Paraglaciecola mesophila TaxID=197222 RepID=A0A857JFB1_9ALTE|nr:SDR family oxidoreductase [Paraglaciecola mesophila]QHJ09910.1 Acetoacetyl-CoA reductase [Paraglaciecola mesophila]
MDLGIKGKKAIIAGGSAGMGKATAIELGKAGCELYISARREARLFAAAKNISELTEAKVTPIVADHASLAGREKLEAACPNPDIMVVTISPPPLVWDYNDITEDDWHHSVDNGLIGPVELMRRFTSGMAERGWGRYVNIATVAAKHPLDMRMLSGPARSALANYTAVVSRKLAKNNVAINSVLPGMYATEGMLEIAGPHKAMIKEKLGLSSDAEITPEIVHRVTLSLFDIPTQTLGQAEDLAQFVAVLCSEAAKFTIGQNFVLDGGMARSIF